VFFILTVAAAESPSAWRSWCAVPQLDTINVDDLDRSRADGNAVMSTTLNENLLLAFRWRRWPAR
jgi:hypothetical protein